MITEDIKQYALDILAEHGCDVYTYGDQSGETIINDLKEGYPDGMKYPYIDVANAIIEVSKRRPLYRAPYKVIWSTEDCTDGYGLGDPGEARSEALHTLVTWMQALTGTWTDGRPDEKQADTWDYMIDNCYVEVYKYDADTDEYVLFWEPSDEDLDSIGWKYISELFGE